MATDAVAQPPELPPPPISGLRIAISPYVEVPGANRLNTLTFQGDNLYVVNQSPDGQIHRINRNGGSTPTVDLFLDLSSALSQNGRSLDFSDVGHGGARAVAFHPEFDTNGKFYTSHMESAVAPGMGANFLGDSTNGGVDVQADSVLAEWTFDFNSSQVDTSSYREVFRVGLPVYDHPIKQIGFDTFAEPGDDNYGLLYIAHGDAGTQNEGTGQVGSDALGKILRIDPLEDVVGGNPYSVPGSNPFVGNVGVLDEVYALGFRNPHNFSFAEDASGDSRLIVADVGQDYAEEVNLVDAGGNYGWRLREGAAVNDANGGGVSELPANDAALGFTYPATSFGHSGPGVENSPVAIHGGAVVTNTGNSALDGQYVFGDFSNRGKLFHATFDDMVNAVTQGPPGDLMQAGVSELGVLLDDDNDPNTPAIATTWLNVIGTRPDTRMGTGPDGEVYLLNKRNGTIYRIEDGQEPIEPPPPPPAPIGRLINFDFDRDSFGVVTTDFEGSAAIGNDGDTWNDGEPEFQQQFINLVDADGNATTAGLETQFLASFAANTADFGDPLNNLIRDYAFTDPNVNGSVGFATITGLGAGVEYTLYLYGVSNTELQSTTFSVAGANEGPQTAATNDIVGDLTLGEDYVIFTGTTGASGEIAITIDGGSNFSSFNGFQLVLAPELAGDFNGDGVVDAADYTVWRDNLGAPDESVINYSGDGGDVSIDDYLLWKANFGNGSGDASEAVATPEPGLGSLAGMAAAVLLRRRRRSRAC